MAWKRLYKLINESQNEEIAFDNDSFVLSTLDLGKANIKSETLDREYGTQYLCSTVGSRDIKLEGWVISRSSTINATSVVQNRNKLQRVLSPRDDVYLVVYDYETITTLKEIGRITLKAKQTVQWSKKPEENLKAGCKFSITCTAFNPFFKRPCVKSGNNYVVNNSYASTTTSVATYSSSRFTVNYIGSRKYTYPTVTVVVSGAVNFSVNSPNGKITVVDSATAAAGTTYLVDVETMHVYKNGVYGQYIDWANTTTRPKVAAGEQFYITSSNTSITFNVDFNVLETEV